MKSEQANKLNDGDGVQLENWSSLNVLEDG